MWLRDRAIDLEPLLQLGRIESPSGPLVLLCIYRNRNASVVESLISSVEAIDRVSIRLWALDEIHPSLEHHTVGTGTGGRSILLNRMIAIDTPAGDVIVCDDDALCTPSLARFVAVARIAGLDLAQPAHSRLGSFTTYHFNRRRPCSVARTSATIEIGPIVYISAGWVGRVFPLPESSPMGWGLDTIWAGLAQEGCRIGVVDRAPLRHLAPVATDYSVQAAQHAARTLIGDGDVLDPDGLDARHTPAVWRPWSRQPPWGRG